jgi:hypothetical protein
MGIAMLGVFVIAMMAVVLILFVTQVVIPVYQGTPLFPQFRTMTPMKEQVVAAEKELEETTELVLVKTQLNEINRRKAELENK